MHTTKNPKVHTIPEISPGSSADLSISQQQEATARFAKAMGHPVRVYILELLSRQNCCYSKDLSEVLPIAKSTLSQHLKELKDAGLIQGDIRPPRIKYCINRENWEAARKLFAELFR